MAKHRSAPVTASKFQTIDTLGNMVDHHTCYYMFTCPACGVDNLPHAIAAGKCYRCDYELTYDDEQIHTIPH